MPYCGRIEDYSVREAADAWVVTIATHYSSSESRIEDLVPKAFPGARLGGPGWLLISDGVLRNTRYTIPKDNVEYGDLERYLVLLQSTVTIADDADESHALDFHRLPHPGVEPGVANWQHTAIGQLVNVAKSYDLASGSEADALRLASHYVDWIQKHPRYKLAHIVVAPPPSNPSKTFDLPRLIAQQVSRQYGLSLVECTTLGEIVPQKTLRDDSLAKLQNLQGKYYIPGDLTSKTILLIDDIYETGTTVNELTRACRVSSADTVLSLTATKSALEARGYSASRWYEAMYSDAETSS